MKEKPSEMTRMSDEIAKLSNKIQDFMDQVAILHGEQQELLLVLVKMQGGNLKDGLELYNRIMKKRKLFEYEEQILEK
jgi:hypothetical protein